MTFRQNYYCRFLVVALLSWGSAIAALAQAVEPLAGGWQLKRPAAGVRVVLDENGEWGGSADNGTTHQNGSDYWIEKTLLVPQEALTGTKQARLRVLMAIQDYSQGGDASKPGNGLDETFDLVVNGQSHTYRTDAGFPSRTVASEPLKWQWHDFLVPVEQLHAGENKFIFRKSAATKGDDYLYIGIDNSIARGHSRSSMDGGKTWTTETLNTVNAKGEYLIRLLLLDQDNQMNQANATWTPRGTRDEGRLLGFAGLENGEGLGINTFNASDAAELASGTHLRLELSGERVDQISPLRLRARFSGAAPLVAVQDAQSKNIEATSKIEDGELVLEVPPSQKLPAVIEVRAPGQGVTTLKEVKLEYASNPFPSESGEEPSDLTPHMAAPKFTAIKRAPAARLTADGFILENGLMQMRFESKPKLRLLSLRHELLGRNVLAHPEETRLFLIESGGQRFGAADWRVQGIKVLPDKKSVEAQLRLPEKSLAALLTFVVDASSCRMKLRISNIGKNAQSWKTAFPQFGGLQLSQHESDDAYLFPFKGSVIGQAAANLRAVYGNETAWWQMMDLFSPTGGAGLSLRADDATGLYKYPVLRKGTAAVPGMALDTKIAGDMDEGLIWQDSLPSAPGMAVTFEYLRRTREASKSFAPPDAVLEFHSGDWHAPMKTYAQWAHRAWKWRPFSPRLNDVWNMVSPGWGSAPLWQDGKYRTDFGDRESPVDLWELYGWWDWAKNAPWKVPFSEVSKLEWEGQILSLVHTVKNPATGEVQWQQNLGDYDGYHPEWGGLPTFQKYIREMQKRGTKMMLYTCPAFVDDNTKTAEQFGKKYGIVNPLWSSLKMFQTPLSPKDYVSMFYGWNMCPDNAEYPEIVAAQMARAIRETGADGLRMDVWGYHGFACTNPLHKHLFAEPGHNAYIQATAYATAKVRAAVDKVDPNTIVTTEFPGADFMMHNLDGAIVYETSWNAKGYPTLRPLPLNLLRFYFPEFRCFDLDDLDPKNRVPGSHDLRFWNAMPSFGVLQTTPNYRVLQENGDAFNAAGAQPLVATLQSRLYANRFASGSKTIWLLINGGRFTSDAPVMKVSADANFHYFDLLNGLEVDTSGGKFAMKLRPKQVGAVARLPRRLSLNKATAGSFQVAVKNAQSGMRLVLCDASGVSLEEYKGIGAQTPIKLPAGGKSAPAYLKLFQGKYLVDAVDLPR